MMLLKIYRSDTGIDDTWSSEVSGQLPMILELDIHYRKNTLGSYSKALKDAP